MIVPPKPTTEDLLAHYAGKPVKLFVHVQGFAGGEPNSSTDVLHPDGNGYSLVSGFTHELIQVADAEAPIRIYIHEAARKEDAIALLRKAADWLERDWSALTVPEIQERMEDDFMRHLKRRIEDDRDEE